MSWGVILSVTSTLGEYRMCSLTNKCVLLLHTVFSYDRMCSLTCHGVWLYQWPRRLVSIECVLLLINAFSYYAMCSHTIECVLLHVMVSAALCWFSLCPSDIISLLFSLFSFSLYPCLSFSLCVPVYLSLSLILSLTHHQVRMREQKKVGPGSMNMKSYSKSHDMKSDVQGHERDARCSANAGTNSHRFSCDSRQAQNLM